MNSLETIDQYIESTNKDINKWMSNPETAWEQSIFNGLGSISRRLTNEDILSLPEPYVGDPLNCSAVFLNYNPGPILKDLQSMQGIFVKDLGAGKDYYNFSLDHPYFRETIPGYTGKPINWWKNRNKFVRRIFDYDFGRNALGLEICPWHSSSFSISCGDLIQIKEYLKERVIDIAIASGEISENKCVLTVGKSYVTLMRLLDFQLLKDQNADSNDFDTWPKNKSGLISRSFSVWKAPNSDVQFFNTYAPGSNNLPGKHFDHIIKVMLS